MERLGRTRNVFIVDDHPIMRHGLKQLIEQEKDLRVCGEAADVKEAEQAVLQAKDYQ